MKQGDFKRIDFIFPAKCFSPQGRNYKYRSRNHPHRPAASSRRGGEAPVSCGGSTGRAGDGAREQCAGEGKRKRATGRMGHGARSGLTRACRSSWEWRLEPFSRCTIRAMVRESPLSGSSIAAPLPAGGLLQRAASTAAAAPAPAPRLLRWRYQATAGAGRRRRGRAGSGASQKGSCPATVTRAGLRVRRGAELRGPLAAQPGRLQAVPGAGETVPVVPSAAATSRAPGRHRPPAGHVHLGLDNGGLELRGKSHVALLFLKQTLVMYHC